MTGAEVLDVGRDAIWLTLQLCAPCLIVGLVVGVCLAENGNTVVCVDNDERKVDALRRGEIPIYEPGLGEMIPRNVAEERLRFTTDLALAVQASDIVFIAVGTPQEEDGSADLRHVLAVAEGIGRAMDGYKVIVNKSTVPVGTTRKVREALAAVTAHPFAVVSNPEFLREGSAIEDTLRPDRIVIGAPSQQVAMTLLELYAPLERPMIITDVPSAEMIKYASNAFLATKISFINAIANICDAVGANVAITNKTSDFYQGDEVQYLEAFNQGKGGVHIGQLSLDESIHSYSIHVGVPVLDQGKPVGVLLAAVNVEKLKHK